MRESAIGNSVFSLSPSCPSDLPSTMSASDVIFIDDNQFLIAAYDADDGLPKQLALRFTVRAHPTCNKDLSAIPLTDVC